MDWYKIGRERTAHKEETWIREHPEAKDVKTVIMAGAERKLPNGLLARFPNATIYLIEPEKDNFEALRQACLNEPRCILINKAIWVANGKATLTVTNSTSSHSLYQRPGHERNTQEVNTMDFAEFLGQFDSIDLLRIDVEGAEYAVLLKCFNEGLMDRVKSLSLELHAHKIAGLTEQHNLLVEKLKRWGMKKSLSIDSPNRMSLLK